MDQRLASNRRAPNDNTFEVDNVSMFRDHSQAFTPTRQDAQKYWPQNIGSETIPARTV